MPQSKIKSSGQVLAACGLLLPLPELYGETPTIIPVELVELGTLGGMRSWAVDINDSGHVAGTSENAEGNFRAFLWTEDDGMIDLGTLGGNSSEAFSINQFGEVVGTADNSSGTSHAFFWSRAGGITDLGTLGGEFSSARAINDQGEVAGISVLEGGQDLRVFLWSASEGMRDVGILGPSLDVTGINNAGQIVGSRSISEDRKRAFIYDPESGITDINVDLSPAFIIQESSAKGINTQGTVVGSYYFRTIPPYTYPSNRTFLFDTSNGWVDLGSLGATSSQALGINDLGWITGHRSPYVFEAFVRIGETTVDLNTLFFSQMNTAETKNPTLIKLVQGNAINNLGQLVGNADYYLPATDDTDFNVVPRGFLAKVSVLDELFLREYPVNEGWANTGEWLGLLWVRNAPWVWSERVGWLWIALETHSSGGIWIYRPVD